MSWVTKQIKTAPHKDTNKALAAVNLEDKYGLSMYNDTPTGEITIEELERAAIDRLKGGVGMRVCILQTPLHKHHLINTQCSKVYKRHAILVVMLHNWPPACTTPSNRS